MKFKDYPYKRPDTVKDFKKLKSLINKFNRANDFVTHFDLMMEINYYRKEYETLQEIVIIRNTIDTKNEFYDQENSFFDRVKPEYEQLVDEFYKALHNSKHKDDLIDDFGDHLFNIIDVKLKTFSAEIIDDLKLENKLKSEYTKLRASAKISFDDKEMNLEQMAPYYESIDRNIRKSAQEATTQFWDANQENFDILFDKLVKVRHKIAVKLGFDNYTDLGYYRLGRTDYTKDDVAKYRKQVLDHLVEFSFQLRNRQMRRLELDELLYYDEPISYLSGNAKPKGDDKWILKQGKKMYSELSDETNEFFSFMLDNELMDLIAKEGKAGGGYCTFLYDYEAPFIFSNFNGTSGDIDVLTHEAGHAFQCYQSRNYTLPEYVWPTLEACEIHSMSMEFFTYPWMKNIFKEDEIKYKFSHLSDAIMFIPYGCLVDEFQHYVYENPELSPKERRSAWRSLEKKYLPHRDYAGNKFYEDGGFWFKQGHIFKDPFYYIDYTLAQFVAFQYYVMSKDNFDEAFKSYIKLCKLGGKYSFLTLLNTMNLKNPFVDGSLESILPTLKTSLEEIDDMSL